MMTRDGKPSIHTFRSLSTHGISPCLATLCKCQTKLKTILTASFLENWRRPRDSLLLFAWILASRTWNPITSPWIKQRMQLRIVHSGDWWVRSALCTPSGACLKWIFLLLCWKRYSADMVQTHKLCMNLLLCSLQTKLPVASAMYNNETLTLTLTGGDISPNSRIFLRFVVVVLLLSSLTAVDTVFSLLHLTHDNLCLRRYSQWALVVNVNG